MTANLTSTPLGFSRCFCSRVRHWPMYFGWLADNRHFQILSLSNLAMWVSTEVLSPCTNVCVVSGNMLLANRFKLAIKVRSSLSWWPIVWSSIERSLWYSYPSWPWVCGNVVSVIRIIFACWRSSCYIAVTVGEWHFLEDFSSQISLSM